MTPVSDSVMMTAPLKHPSTHARCAACGWLIRPLLIITPGFIIDVLTGFASDMGVKIFTSGPFDVLLCAAACSSQSEYNIAHLPADGIPQTCQFFNTYVLYDNNQAVGQYCALYNETWPATFATNSGQYESSDYYSIAYSYAFSNTTNGANEHQGCTNPTSP